MSNYQFKVFKIGIFRLPLDFGIDQSSLDGDQVRYRILNLL